MFAYEATRYDANATDYGFDSTRRPCSVPDRRPWSNVTKEEATAACGKIGTGWRLCTSAEWLDACNGSGNTTFPYGDTYNAQRCNGWDFTRTAGATTLATGAATMCVSDPSTTAGDELFDMSGNVKEWVHHRRRRRRSRTRCAVAPTTPPASRSTARRRLPGLQCDAATPAPPTVPVRLPSVGFRCCRTGMLALTEMPEVTRARI